MLLFGAVLEVALLRGLWLLWRWDLVSQLVSGTRWPEMAIEGGSGIAIGLEIERQLMVGQKER